MMSLWDALRMNMMISYQELVRTFPKYYRIQPELYGADPTLDNASRENLELLRKAGLQNAAVYDKKLPEIAKLLISSGGNFKYQDAN
ncbi:hypothetical protein [Citrobacter freundii]|uniref:hypothetical protein n=1 Tax=Citrobacter freundii TaxID=546 RepID=UPI002E1132B2